MHVIEANMKISERKDLENYLCPENWKLVLLVCLQYMHALDQLLHSTLEKQSSADCHDISRNMRSKKKQTNKQKTSKEEKNNKEGVVWSAGIYQSHLRRLAWVMNNMYAYYELDSRNKLKCQCICMQDKKNCQDLEKNLEVENGHLVSLEHHLQ